MKTLLLGFRSDKLLAYVIDFVYKFSAVSSKIICGKTQCEKVKSKDLLFLSG